MLPLPVPLVLVTPPAFWVLSAVVNCAVAVSDFYGVTAIGYNVTGLYWYGRAGGLTVHPNHLGLVAAMALPIALSRFVTARDRDSRAVLREEPSGREPEAAAPAHHERAPTGEGLGHRRHVRALPRPPAAGPQQRRQRSAGGTRPGRGRSPPGFLAYLLVALTSAPRPTRSVLAAPPARCRARRRTASGARADDAALARSRTASRMPSWLSWK